MLVSEILSEAFGGRANPEDYNWHRDREQNPTGDDLSSEPGTLWNVYSKTGGLIRANLPASSARALLKNRELIKKHGQLTAKKATQIKEMDNSREPYPFHRDSPRSAPVSNWGIKDKSGKIIRQGMSKEAAMAVAQRSDLIKKYGPLRAIPIG